jgi:restriction endonuclease S subunit
MQLSNVDKNTVEGEEPVRLCNYIDVYNKDLITADLELMGATATLAEVRKFMLQDGDVLITKDSESWDDIAVPAYVVGDHEGILCGYHLAQVRSNPSYVDGKYLFYSFYARGVNDQFRVATTGITRYSLGKYWLDNGLFPVPPIDEQRVIAAFLDHETARIDTLIEKRQRQIELLHEKRAALITHAVTKGLNPGVKMKNSGVEWLGEIPTHWEAIRFKFLLSEQLAYGANESAEYDEPTWPRYIRITDINENGTIRDETFKSLPEDVARPYLLKEGDLLFARSGATVGKTLLYLESWGRAAYAGYLIRSRLNQSEMIPAFAAYFCCSNNYWDWLRSSFIQATIQNVSAERYANMVVPKPPIKEQREITKRLDENTSAIDRMTERISHSIETLREYRSALISAAVTGEIDVRKEVV